MARDYAQRGPRRSQTQQHGRLPSWVWLIFALSMFLAGGAFVYIARPAGSLSEQLSTTSAPMPTPQPPTPAPATKNGRLPLPPEEKERFSFYETLKKQKVYIPRDDRPVPKTAAPKAEELFLIQVASYRSMDEAEKEKARLALVGAEARIEKVTVDDRETYYRVRIGPLGADRTQTTLNRLQENGIQGMVVKAN